MRLPEKLRAWQHSLRDDDRHNQEWIRECNSSHAICSMDQGGQVLEHPKRILELKSDTIILRDDLLRPYSYACLSHCVSHPSPRVSFMGRWRKASGEKRTLSQRQSQQRLINSKLVYPSTSWQRRSKLQLTSANVWKLNTCGLTLCVFCKMTKLIGKTKLQRW